MSNYLIITSIINVNKIFEKKKFVQIVKLKRYFKIRHLRILKTKKITHECHIIKTITAHKRFNLYPSLS